MLQLLWLVSDIGVLASWDTSVRLHRAPMCGISHTRTAFVAHSAAGAQPWRSEAVSRSGSSQYEVMSCGRSLGCR